MAGKSDIVKGALDFTAKLLSGEGDDAAKAGIRAYHGTWNDNLTGFDNSLLGQNFNNRASKAGHWFSTNPDDAAFFGDNVYEIELSGNYKTLPSMEEMGKNVREKLNNTVYNSKVNDDTSSAAAKYVDYLDTTHAPSHYTNATAAELSKARRAGFDGAKLKGGEMVQNVSGTGDHYVVFNPELIRIIRKLGIAGASSMLGYNLMEQLDPKQALAATMADEEYRVGKAGGGAVREGYAGRGRVAKGIADEVVDLAKRILGSEPEVRKVTGAELLKKTEGLSEDPFGFSKFSKPLSEMEYTVKMLPREEYKSLDPYDLVKQNATIVGHISDRTAAGREVSNIGGVDLTEPLKQRGGVDFQRTTPHAWANRPGAGKTLNKKLNEAAKGGDPVYTTPVFMGASSANSSHMVGAPLIRMIPNLPISQADKLAFDAMMSERFPGWPGINNTEAAEKFMYSGNVPGSAISRFIDYASAKKWKGAGFPDASEIMFSAMDPRLVGVPQGSTGMGFKEFDPGKEVIINGPESHPDYPASIPGKGYAGGFKYQVPQSLMMSDWWKSLKPELRLPENATKAQHTLMTQIPTQKATPEWADRILESWEKNPKPWGYADGGEVDDDIYHAVRLARDVGGATNENPSVFLTDAQGRQYDAQGKPIQPVATQEQSNSAATQAAPTPEQVGRRAAEDPATFDALIQKYAVPDRDVAEYEALQTAVRQQPQEVQQMTHVGAPPMRDIKVDMPLFGGEYNVGQAPYNVAGPLATTAQTAYDLKTAPLYMTPMTAPIGAGLDVAEGVTTGDPLQASLAALGVPGKYAKAAIIGASNYAMDPAQAEAGPARWFSKAMEVAREIPMNKMTGEQALAMLRKGTSPEELRWTGADAFLQGKPTVTKEELVDYLNKNRLQLGEVRLGGEKPEAINYLNQVDKDILERYQPKLSAAEAEHKKALDYFHSVFGSEAEESAWKLVTDSKRDLTDLQLAAMQEMKDRVGTYLPTKYQDKSTSGGEGYAETLYTLGGRKKPRVENRNGMWAIVDENGNVMRAPHGGEYTYWSEGDANRAAGSLYRGSGIYQSGHWDHPDVLAHSRSQTLSYDPPGANRPYRVHNVDETQSDWGQAARKTGFYDPETYGKWERDTKETKEAIRDLSDKLAMRADEIDESLGPKPTRGRGDEFNNYHERRQDAIAADPKIQEMRKQIEDYRLKLMQLDENKPSIGGVPKAPFIGSTEGWTDLAIKKQLDNALDSDADYFSWTPGQAHADRYDLSKHIGSVVYDPYHEQFNAYDPNGRHLVAEDMRDAARIDEYVGKELADKIRDMAKQRKNEFYDGITIEESPKIGAQDNWAIVKDGKPITLYGQKATGFPNKADAAEFLDDAFGDTLKDNPIKLSGLDLKTGGEGMKGYYDKVYLKRVQDVIKKATGTKPEIEVIEVQTGDGPRKQLGVKLTDEMREKARFSDFNRGGTVTGPHSYGNDDPAVSRAIALTREY